MASVWIAVEISDGMFSSEYAVAIATAEGSQVSFFVDKSLVREEHGAQKLKVTLIDSDRAAHKSRVLLPVEAFETSSRWVDVPGVLSAA